jgi:acetyl esterase
MTRRRAGSRTAPGPRCSPSTGGNLAPYLSHRLGSVPPTLVLVAECDVLADEDVELARRMAEAGAVVEVATYPGLIHGFWRHPELFDAAEDSLVEIAGFLDRHV